MTRKLKATRSSGNVFADIGFGHEEAENLMLRAQLMSRIREAARGITQREAAKKFAVSQPRLNDLVRGKIDKFSLDALVIMLAHAGMSIELKPPMHNSTAVRAAGDQGAPAKRVTSLRIDADVLEYFRSSGPDFQTRINQTLRREKERGEARLAASRGGVRPKPPEVREAKARYRAADRRRGRT
jgi:predicted XRE-type DNA-binding protein